MMRLRLINFILMVALGMGEGWGISITSSLDESNIKHEGSANFAWGCMSSRGMGYMCKIEVKMTQALRCI